MADAGDAPGRTSVESMRLTRPAASDALDAFVQQATSFGARMVGVIVDDAGTLHAFGRMDGSPLASVTFATDKAYTAAALGRDTTALGQAFYGDLPLEHGYRALPRVLAFQGGYPVDVEGDLVGGIAVGGSRPENDEHAAQAAADAIRKRSARQSANP